MIIGKSSAVKESNEEGDDTQTTSEGRNNKMTWRRSRRARERNKRLIGFCMDDRVHKGST